MLTTTNSWAALGTPVACTPKSKLPGETTIPRSTLSAAMVTAPSATGPPPVCATVKVCAPLVVPMLLPGKAWLPGVREIVPVGGATPVPLSATACDPSGASLAIVSVPLAGPVAEGEKVTPTVQFCPGRRVAAEHWSLAVAKADPLIPALLIWIAELPTFVTVTVCTALVVPVACEPNERESGVTVREAATVPVPVSVEL
ncbi:MAG: hypothetical protein U0232_07960 [Thermomicrobiales bacterium]